MVTVLIGECTGKPAARARALGWGRMWIARGRNIYTYPGEPWGLDNGAFRDWAKGRPFDGDKFLAVVDKAMQHPRPVLAVVPDAPGDAAQTLRMADEWLPRLPRSLPWYIAVQDGMNPNDLDSYPISGVFLGGTNAMKARASEFCEYAHGRGLPFHYGRCGTLNKLAHALEVGADSIDSAFPMWTMKRWHVFARCVQHGPEQLSLFA